MAQQPDLFDDVTDPDALQAGVSAADQTAVDNSRDWASRSIAVSNQGANTAANGLSQVLQNPNIGDPRVVQARKISDAMKTILQDSNQNAPADEDPLDKNLRVSQAIAQRMLGVSPSIALQALAKSQQLQEAKAQQSLLTAQGQEAQQKVEQG